MVIVQRRLTHYRVPLFEKLRNTLEENNVEMRLVVGEGTERERSKQDSGEISWADSVPTRYWMNEKICGPPTYRHVKGADLVIVTQEMLRLPIDSRCSVPCGRGLPSGATWSTSRAETGR